MAMTSDQKLLDVFSKAFHEVVVPELEEIKETLVEVDEKAERIENNLQQTSLYSSFKIHKFYGATSRQMRRLGKSSCGYAIIWSKPNSLP